MIDIKAMAIGAALGGLVLGGAGLQLGKSMERSACDKRLEVVQRAAASLIDAKDREILVLGAEKAQAQGEVAKVNAATLAQFEEMKQLLTADQAKRDAAAVRVEAAAKQAALNARDAAAKSIEARKVIQNVADQCARAGVPDDVVRVLNDILVAP